ncbi:hypothetical protein NMY22_g14847 [Coprinellus aureogranulatus]|nr:hypothetical protein NMY22_g14847 [Coprinellus aureogranulatus]
MDTEVVVDEPVEHTVQDSQHGSLSREVTSIERRRLSVLDRGSWKVTPQNDYRLYKKYWTLERRPHDPDHFTSEQDLRDGEDDDPQELIRPGPSGRKPPSPKLSPLYPFPNLSSFALGEWYWSDDHEKSERSFQRLRDIITSEDFIPRDLLAANWKRINASLASSVYEDSKEIGWDEDGESWQSVSVSIHVPFDSQTRQPGFHDYTVNGFRCRPLLPIIVDKLQDRSQSDRFHLVPSELFWKPVPNGQEVRVYGELYQSAAFLDAFREVQTLPPEDSEDWLPRCVVALMFSSDETMLASFGTAQAWPVYMLFGNVSKYQRGKVSSKLFEEVAYLQKLPDEFDDWYIRMSGKRAVGKTLAAHLARELFHEQWKVLLNDDFVHAYSHGVVVDCFDNVRRRVYPRILTYAADYPERTTVVSIRQMGACPCPRCLIPTDMIHSLGTAEDRQIRDMTRRRDTQDQKLKVQDARDLIFNQLYAVNSPVIEDVLKLTSLVPSQNAFSDRLSNLGLDIYDMVSVDILHEVEIGVWKTLFIHLLRLLEALGTSGTGILNSRFRQVPTFGRDTIRRFCILPVIEGLFPGDHEGRVHNLVFTLAHWHSLAKLRLHTDSSLAVLDALTTELGSAARNFIEHTCKEFETRELKREFEARKRRATKAMAKKNSTKESPLSTTGGKPQHGLKPNSSVSGPSSRAPQALRATEMATVPQSPGSGTIETHRAAPPTQPFCAALPPNSPHREPRLQASVSADAGSANPSDLLAQQPASSDTDRDSRKPQTWSISTSKFHALGDFVAYIRRFGTTDSYSTQLSERFHRFSKARYRRTNKKDIPRQLSQIKTRQARIQKLRKKLFPESDELKQSIDSSAVESSPKGYFIGQSQNDSVNLGRFLSLKTKDPAVEGFFPKLKRHLFPRVIARLLAEAKANLETLDPRIPVAIARLEALSASFTEQDMGGIYFHADRIYRHKILQIDVSTYDCRLGCDVLNPSTSRRDFMCLRAEEPTTPGQEHGNEVVREGCQYAYGRLLGVFHANIVYGGPGSTDLRRRRFDFLWIRWFVPAKGQSIASNAWSSKRLDRLSLPPLAHPESCDFLDPADVLRAAHLIPRFATGKVPEEPGRLHSRFARDEDDWIEYYVNRFVDRDMTMRFHPGIAIGHVYSHPSPDQDHSRADLMEVDHTDSPSQAVLDGTVQGPHDIPMAGPDDLSSDSDDFDAYNGNASESDSSGETGEGEEEGSNHLWDLTPPSRTRSPSSSIVDVDPVAMRPMAAIRGLDYSVRCLIAKHPSISFQELAWACSVLFEPGFRTNPHFMIQQLVVIQVLANGVQRSICLRKPFIYIFHLPGLDALLPVEFEHSSLKRRYKRGCLSESSLNSSVASTICSLLLFYRTFTAPRRTVTWNLMDLDPLNLGCAYLSANGTPFSPHQTLIAGDIAETKGLRSLSRSSIWT